MKNNKKRKYIIIGIAFTILIMLGASYALWTTSEEQKSMNVLNTNCIKLEMEELSGEIKLEKAYPILDKEGEELDPYKFRIKNVCNTGVDYNVNIEVLEESTMEAKNIAAKIDEELKVLLTPTHQTTLIETEEYNAKEAYNIYTGNLKPNESKEHEIRLWMDESAGNESQNKTFKAKVVINGTSNEIGAYTEKLLNGADPILKGELVPVTIDENGTVKKADITTEWYKYEDKKWANAVILVDNSKVEEIKAGDEIEEDQIESYFVWIPKYKYKIFDEKLGKYSGVESQDLPDKGPTTVIEIEFGLEDTTDTDISCETPMNEEKTQGLSGGDGNCAVNKWMTHPSFISFKANGFWVGKFETGYNQDTSNLNRIEVTNSWNTSGAQIDTNDSAKVIIKPNVYSWRGLTVKNMFEASYDYQRELDSHMMKNTEWGAAAYLTQSKYGMCSENSCTEIAQNTKNSFMTGYTTTAFPNSQSASTTNNNTGIFDMSGGAWDEVISIMKNQDGQVTVWNQNGLNIIENTKYYDLYNYGDDFQHWERRILGDATGEMGPFRYNSGGNMNSYFKDCSEFMTSSVVWVDRGAGHFNPSNLSGVFAFNHNAGQIDGNVSFRIVLTP